MLLLRMTCLFLFMINDICNLYFFVEKKGKLVIFVVLLANAELGISRLFTKDIIKTLQGFFSENQFQNNL